ncbi:MAG: DMT family transporter [Ruminococcaceae bacterium]|nr:DMT family transporter [Oscillospiraceae bacterium]
MNRLKANVMLLLAAFIWGTAFVAQSVGMDSIGPVSFNCVRMFIGSLTLIPVIYFRRFMEKRKSGKVEKIDLKKHIIGGAACGAFLFLASVSQQMGLVFTTPAKSGFITALYVVLVPIVGLFFKKKVRWNMWVAVVLAAAGLYFLCIQGSFVLQLGDLLTLICAFMYTFHVLTVDHFSPETDPVILSCLQFFFCSLFSFCLMFFIEEPSVLQIYNAAIPILYTGVLSSGVAFTFQVCAQKHTSPTVASLLMCLESVFAVLAGMVILSQIPSPAEAFGCVLMFVAIVLGQIFPEKE